MELFPVQIHNKKHISDYALKIVMLSVRSAYKKYQDLTLGVYDQPTW